MTPEQITDDLLTCPECGFRDELDVFDVLGACPGNVFCVQCHTEFDSWTGVQHKRGVCCETTMGTAE